MPRRAKAIPGALRGADNGATVQRCGHVIPPSGSSRVAWRPTPGWLMVMVVHCLATLRGRLHRAKGPFIAGQVLLQGQQQPLGMPR